ncbi:MAG: L-lactate permease, partial [Candidatus Thorarchaeota archaeon]|nr:L-lactate permease [Candidatus Thorarchaeota archaeon]
ATLVSMPFFKNDKAVLKNTFNKFMKRAPRPVLAAAIFFAMAEVLNFSGFVPGAGGVWIFPTEPTNNMVYLLASLTSVTLGKAYPLTAAFLGLLAGFISGSETSAIAMFTNYHYQASTAIGANAVIVAASSGIGGGLASVLSPAKIQNAAAVIDQIGIEGQVIRYGAVVAILITAATAIMTMMWAFI